MYETHECLLLDVFLSILYYCIISVLDDLQIGLSFYTALLSNDEAFLGILACSGGFPPSLEHLPFRW